MTRHEFMTSTMQGKVASIPGHLAELNDLGGKGWAVVAVLGGCDVKQLLQQRPLSSPQASGSLT